MKSSTFVQKLLGLSLFFCFLTLSTSFAQQKQGPFTISELQSIKGALEGKTWQSNAGNTFTFGKNLFLGINGDYVTVTLKGSTQDKIWKIMSYGATLVNLADLSNKKLTTQLKAKN